MPNGTNPAAGNGASGEGPLLTVVNLSHPLSDQQLEQLARHTELPIGRIIQPDNQIDLGHDVPAQVSEMVDGVGLTSEQWQTEPIVVVLPGLSISAAVLMAEIHGRTGYFPTVAMVRRADGPVPRFEVGGVISLQTVREQARRKR